jgi:glycosidase
MSTLDTILASPPPDRIAEAIDNWPERGYTPSPADWRDHVFYFLLPDRFSSSREQSDRLLDADLSTQDGRNRIRSIRGDRWRWDEWQRSGGGYYQGGTLKGIISKLGYLKELGVTTIWIGPVFRQRTELDTYHGYGIQNFFDVDPRFGSRRDLVELVNSAHSTQYDMRVVLDVIFNHSGCNWLYDNSAGDMRQPPYRPYDSYDPIWPRNGFGTAIYDRNQLLGADDFVWPRELQEYYCYIRAGSGNLGAGDINDDYAEHKRTDFCDLRKFNLYSGDTLNTLILCYQYWIALTDADGFRIDTFKHVTQEQARNFCNGIKEYAESIGKDDFFLVAEIAGGSSPQDRYLDVTGRNLNACLDIGEQRGTLCSVSKGLQSASDFFAGFSYYDPGMGSHRNYGSRHLSISNDHDHVSGAKIRYAADASNDHQAAAVAALQLFTLGIPCIYYGTEQGLASGAEPQERGYLSNWGSNDALLREAMFGPEHPRATGFNGTQGEVDTSIPGFGPHGTAGWHVFNTAHPVYTRIKQLAAARASYHPLRRGRQYQRATSFLSGPFGFHGPGELAAWSRIFDDQEIVIIVNPHGTEERGGKITVDRILSSSGFRVIVNTNPDTPAALRTGAFLPAVVIDGRAVISLDNYLIAPSEVMVCGNLAAVDAAV